MQNENERTRAFALNSSPENYLIAISEISAEKGGSARQYEIVEYMGFSKPSILRGVNILAQKGLVTIGALRNHTRDIYLTDAGRALADKLLEKRRIVAAFLVSLGIPEDDAKAEAHLWKRGLSDETAAAMKTFLSRP